MPTATQQHSPTPWSEEPEGAHAVAIEGADGTEVCHVLGTSGEPRCEANCRLIVDAVNAHAQDAEFFAWAIQYRDEMLANIAPLREAADAGTGSYDEYDEEYNVWLEGLEDRLYDHLRDTERLVDEGGAA